MFLGVPVLSLGTEKGSDFIVAYGIFSLGMEVEEEHACICKVNAYFAFVFCQIRRKSLKKLK